MSCLRARLYLYTAAIWVLTAARFLAWLLMTGSLVMGASWYGRPGVAIQWLAAGPPARPGPDRKPIVVALEAARGVAAMECWIQDGCPPPAYPRGRHGNARPDAAS